MDASHAHKLAKEQDIDMWFDRVLNHWVVVEMYDHDHVGSITDQELKAVKADEDFIDMLRGIFQ